MAQEDDLDFYDSEYSWHPFTQMQEYLEAPKIHISKGKGCWLWDVDSKHYLDTNASIWTNVHGHNDPELNQVLKDQLEKVAHSTYLGLSHPVAARLSKKLVDISPENLSRIYYSDNGSNAVEIALKLSLQYWKNVGQPERTRVIGMQGGYHGDTIGTMAVGNSGRFHECFQPWFLDAFHFPAPECETFGGQIQYQNDVESLTILENYLKNEAEKVCCLVIEPSIQGAAGMQMQPQGFLKKVESLCRQYGIHLILDEVFVAFGRTGSMFVCEQENVQPDFLCLAKGLTAGYLPLAATLIDSKVFDAFLGPFEANKTFFHGHTFTANPLASAVSLKSIEKLEQLIASGQLASTIDYFSAAFQQHLAEHPNVQAIRQRGLAAAVDIYPGVGKKAWPTGQRMGWKLCLEARKHGLLLRPIGDSFMIVPPLIISKKEIDFMFSAILKTLQILESA